NNLGGGGQSQLNLPTLAFYSEETEQTIQISDTQGFGSKLINETRFQYNRDDNLQNPTNTNPVTDVLDNFVGGGNGQGHLSDRQNSYELQNYTSLIHANHSIKFGARVRGTQDSNYSTSGFNGTFVFSALTGNPNLTPTCLGQNPPCPISLAFAMGQIQ